MLFGLLLALPAVPSALPIDDADEAFKRRVTPVVRVIRDASPAVVFIQNEGKQTVGRNIFGQLVEREFSGTGSGVVIHKDGFIITNYHVVDGAKKLTVSFDEKYDSNKYAAEIVSAVKEEDLALLRIRSDHEFPTIPMGISSDLMLGETVIAIGNPYGQTHTATQGIISGLHRNVPIPTNFGVLTFDDLIQTDTSINPGNSGGPLININGELIGINNAMNPNAQNIGFAIPVDHVKQVFETRMLSVESAPTWLGFEVGAGDHLQVTHITPGSPAELAGLRQGDCIVAVAGTPVGTHEEYKLARVGLSPAHDVELQVERSGNSRKIRLTPWDRSDGTLYEHVGLKVEDKPTRFGTTVVRVTEVRPGGPAAELGLKVGDVFDAVRLVAGARGQSYRVVSRENFAQLIAQLEPGARMEVDVYRDVDGDGRFEEEELHRGTLAVR